MSRPQPTSHRTRWLYPALIVAVLASAAGGGLVALRSGSGAAHAAPAYVMGWTPGITRGVPLGGPLTVYFSRAVDHTSVERAWSLSPAVRGSFSWASTSVAFHPTGGFRPGTYYSFHIGPTARDDNGNPLAARLATAFTTGDALAVRSVMPPAGTVGVPSNGLIAVTFNHPMVPLAGIDAPHRDPGGWQVSISPSTAGHGSWLGTSTWVFHPASGLVPSSAYTVTVAGSTRDESGQPLGKEVTWAFRTETPAVVNHSPSGGARTANPAGDVTVDFNQAMDLSSSANAFSLHSPVGNVSGSIRWNGKRLVFHPARPLHGNVLYTATISASARSASGAASLRTPFSWQFSVAPPPHVLFTTPTGASVSPSSYAEFHFSAPMDKSSLDRHLTVTPSIEHMNTDAYAAKGSGSDIYGVYGVYGPSTTYTLSLSAGAKDVYGRPLTEPYTLRFTTAPLAPSVQLYGGAAMSGAISITAGRVVDAPVQFVNVASAQFTLVRVDPTAQINTGGSGGALTVPPGQMIRSWSTTIPQQLNAVQNMNASLANANGSPLAPGLYWLGVQGPTIAGNTPSSTELVVVSNTGVTMKVSQTQVLVWATSARTGVGLAGARMQLIDGNNKVLDTGTTDGDGLHLFHISPQQNVQSAVLDDGTHFGMAMTDWQAMSPATTPSRTSAGVYTAPPNGTYAYTDRPIYRPGQTVHFRAVLWQDHDGRYIPYRGASATVRASDGQNRLLYTGTVVVDDFGSVGGSFALPAHAATGFANVQVTLPPNTSGGPTEVVANFNIAEYRKPEFLTTVTTDRRTYASGTAITATAQVKYVFGAAVAGQRVDWTAYAQDLFSQPPGWDGYTFVDQAALDRLYAKSGGYGPGGGQFGASIATGSGVTDEAGRLMIRVPAQTGLTGLARTITVEATTTDISHQSVTGRAQAALYGAQYVVGIHSQQQVVPAGTAEKVDVAAVLPDGREAGVSSLTATVYRRTYTSVLSPGQFGGTFWQDLPHDAMVQSIPSIGLTAGKGSFTFTPATGGEYYVAVVGKDDAQNTARGGMYVYASAAGFSDWGTSTDSGMTLSPDRNTYTVGQTAHILVAAPFADSTALITVERGTIRSFRVQHLVSNSPTVDIPVTLHDLPNVFVSVTVYHGARNGSSPEWRYGATTIHVSVDPRRLVVHLAQDRARYRPGAPVKYSVTTTDAQGRPVSAELSVALVDTAVLALADETSADILTALYGEQLLGVMTSSSGVISIDRLGPAPQFRVTTGGGGGGGGGGGPVPVYRRFDDTGYWSATVQTDGSGHAKVRLTLPDNFTTWRLDVRGITRDQRVGQANLLTLSTQDMVVRPVLPRFFLQGDALRVGAVVNNTLNSALTTSVLFTATGLTVQSAEKQDVTVPAHGERLLLWDVSVPSSTSATLAFRAIPAQSGVQGYRIENTLPVHPPLTDETVASSGQVFGASQTAVLVPASAMRSPGALTIQVSSSLVAGIGNAFPQFGETPYDSNEDLANRLHAAAVLLGLPASLSGLSSKTRGRLPSIIATAVARLHASQLPDGGWAWYNGPGAQSDPLITADVAEALSTAGGTAYLIAALPTVSPSVRAHLLAVLGATAPRASTDALYSNTVVRAHLDPPASADLALALDDSGQHAAAKSILSTLQTDAMVSVAGAHWEAPLGSNGTAVTATARVLKALIRLTPNDPYVPAAARWLMLAREGPQWASPRDTVEALSALGQYARAAHEGDLPFSYTVSVDGATKLRGTLSPTSKNAGLITEPVGSLHHGAPSTFSVMAAPANGSKVAGRLYFVARLRYFLHASAIAARDEGITVQRRYLDRAGRVLTSATVGSLVRVEITVRTPQTLTYLNVQDPIPAGLEAVDASLNTSRQGMFSAWQGLGSGPSDLANYLDHTDIRDDRMSLYAHSVPPGTYHFTYLAQATTVGRYEVAPTHAAESFFPEVFGRSAGQVFEVR